MKKGFISILIVLLCFSSVVFANQPENASLKLRGSVPMEDVKIVMIDENGLELNGTEGEVAFVFSPGVFEPVSHTVTMRYSANLPSTLRCEVAFDLSDLVFDQNNRIETSMELFSSDSTNVIVNGDSMVVTFAKGISSDRELATMTITAMKDSTNMLPTGDYEGALTIRYTSTS